MHAPTFRASVSDKESFFHDLQLVINGMATDDILVVMGDWNAWVGSIGGDSLWDRALGRHGVGAVNEARLSFCVLNELPVMRRSWQHPGTKIWHCIDHNRVRGGGVRMSRCPR